MKAPILEHLIDNIVVTGIDRYKSKNIPQYSYQHSLKLNFWGGVFGNYIADTLFFLIVSITGEFYLEFRAKGLEETIECLATSHDISLLDVSLWGYSKTKIYEMKAHDSVFTITASE